VLAYTVSRRTREFGLRMALGAQRRSVLAGVLREGVLLVTIGVAGGLVAAMSVTGLLGKFLLRVSPTDTATFVTTPVILLAVAVIACIVPAWRATKVDPMRALRED
jgi:ABC-type antimicrobial peptide transport system permease subunit